MTMRKTNYAQDIAILKNQVATIKVFVDSAVKEAEALGQKKKLSKKEEARVAELTEYIRDKNAFLLKATETIKAFYAPVSA